MSRTVLSFGAHPDDIEIGCGGTEALLVGRGYGAVHAILTSGEAGSARVPPAELGRLREAEAREAASVLGVEEVVFLGQPDGSARETRELRIELIQLIRRVRPSVVFVHSSQDDVPDHRVAHEAVLAALAAAGGPWYAEAGGEPHEAGTVLGYEVWRPLSRHQLSVDVTRTFDRKLAALRCHRSQLAGIPYDEAAEGLARYRGVMTLRGKHAEVFEVLRLGDGFTGHPPG